ncbi:MAG: DNA helicase RecG, partial [Anaerolineae bacterium]
MTAAFETLGKILELEREQGYKNKAVIRGLEALINTWPVEAVKEAPAATSVVEQIVSLLRGYGSLPDGEARQERVAQIMEKLVACQKIATTPPAGRPAPATGAPAQVSQAGLPAPAPPPPSQEKSVRLGLDSSVLALSGVGQAQAKRLERLGVMVIRDLLYLFPHRYNDFSALKTINQLEYGEEVTIIGTIWETKSRRARSGGTIVQSIIADGTATIQATWFNQPYLLRSLKTGRQIVLSGKVDAYLGRLVMNSPEWEFLEKEQVHTGRLVPVYPLTEGIKAKWLRRLMKRTVDYWTKRVPDYLPRQIRESRDLVDLEMALLQIHFPDDWESWERARWRLSFDEFLLIQLGVLRQRQIWRSQPGRPLDLVLSLLETFYALLPYALTSAQKRAVEEIVNDLKQSQPMSRLLQGDVGSGKTVVAAAAMLMAATSDAQAELMAPTEIQAEHHLDSLLALYQGLKSSQRP